MRELDPKYRNTDKTMQEMLNGERGGEPWTPSNYSTEPEYEKVNENLFKYLEKEILEE